MMDMLQALLGYGKGVERSGASQMMAPALMALLGKGNAGAMGGSGSLSGTNSMFPMTATTDFDTADPRAGINVNGSTPGFGAVATPLGFSGIPNAPPGTPNVGAMGSSGKLGMLMALLGRGRSSMTPPIRTDRNYFM